MCTWQMTAMHSRSYMRHSRSPTRSTACIGLHGIPMRQRVSATTNNGRSRDLRYPSSRRIDSAWLPSLTFVSAVSRAASKELACAVVSATSKVATSRVCMSSVMPLRRTKTRAVIVISESKGVWCQIVVGSHDSSSLLNQYWLDSCAKEGF